MTRRRRLFLLAYTASGFAGLVYEVSWTRLLTLTMGHTTPAASTVVAAFMGGLAAGAGLGGRAAARLSPKQSLRLYLALEGLVAIVALALPLELQAISPLLRWAYADGAPGVLFPIVRLTACLALLVLPALALGATFPVAVRWFVHDEETPGASAGALYAANTIGAALGAVLAGFVLLPSLGLRFTIWVGVGGSALAMLAVIGVARGSRAADAPSVQSQDEPVARPARQARPHPRGGRMPRRASAPGAPAFRPQWALAAVVVGLTGFATLTYEIGWMRVFALTSGPSTYAFAGTVAAIITGLAVGSAVGAALAARVRRPGWLLAAALAMTALDGAVAASYAGKGLPRAIASQLASGLPSDGLNATRAWLLAQLVMPIALGLGAAFPLTLQLGTGTAAAQQRIAWRVGALYAVNTLASVAASLATGFLFIRWLGLERTVALASAALVLASVLVTIFGSLSRAGRLASGGLAAMAVTGLVMAGPWDRELLASGAYKYAAVVSKTLDLETALKAGSLLYYRDGAAATVSVKELTGERSLSVDGKVDASTSVDMLTQKALAHLPLLLHPQPRSVAIIGLGSGVTLASALRHPVAAVDVVEIAPEVVEASRFFARQNHQALVDPRVRLIIGDGRSHLQLATRQYDVIISEPSNPWMAGIAALFTREFLSAARARLLPGGLLCQWAHTYNMSDADLRSIVATFASVFPNGTLWLMGDGDLLLLGSASAGPIPLEPLSAGWRRPGVAADLRAVGAAEPFAFLSSYVGGPAEMRRYGAAAPVQTDDRMALEFSAPRALYRNEAEAIVATLRGLLDGREAPPAVAQAWASAGAAERRHRAEMLLKANAYAAAYSEFAAAIDRDPGDADAASGLVRAAVAAQRTPQAQAFLDRAVAAHPAAIALKVARAKLLAATGAYNEAIAAVKNGVAASALAPEALDQLASIYTDIGDADGLREAAAALRRVAPDGRAARYYTAALQFLEQDFVGAAQSARMAVQADPHFAPARNLLGAILATTGRADEARAEFRAALDVDPRDPAIYTNLGRLESSAGNRAAAAGLYAEALSLDPTWDAAREGLAEVQAR